MSTSVSRENPRVVDEDGQRLAALGRYMRERRRALGLTQTHLAGRLGWMQERISLLENGKYGMPSLPALERLAGALEVPLLHLLEAAGYAVLPEDAATESGAAVLLTVQRLIGIEAADLRDAMTQVANLLHETLAAEKVDAFLLEPDGATLFALGVSDTPLGRLQEQVGLNRLPLTNGGSIARTFLSHQPHLSGDVQHDDAELQGIRDLLRIDSAAEVPLWVNGEIRGVLVVTSTQPQRFDETDLRFLQAVSRWVGVLAHRAELMQALAQRSLSDSEVHTLRSVLGYLVDASDSGLSDEEMDELRSLLARVDTDAQGAASTR